MKLKGALYRYGNHLRDNYENPGGLCENKQKKNYFSLHQRNTLDSKIFSMFLSIFLIAIERRLYNSIPVYRKLLRTNVIILLCP